MRSFFFFKQKTAYEIYQCDWSSDVCSSDLGPGPFAFAALGLFIIPFSAEFGWNRAEISFCLTQIGRASCRERV